MRLEASKRMRLVPKGYIRPSDTQQKIGPPTQLFRSTPIKKPPIQPNCVGAQQQTQNERNLMDNRLPTQIQRVVLDTQNPIVEDFPQYQQDEQDPLAVHSSEQLRIVKEDLDPLEVPDVPEEYKAIVKVEPDLLELRLSEQWQQMIKAEQDPLEVHPLPEPIVIKKEYDDGQEVIPSLDAELRCWATTHQIPPAAFDALLVLLRGTKNFELSAVSKP
uniref:Uncharacterized protein n=1 Tax=Anopheles culicifacies TaxID=139723 RepID=A0A182MCE3_9DIPT